MKKVGLITYYGENYGGMLQAYALQQYVNNAGYMCRVISNDFLYLPTGKSQLKRLCIKGGNFLRNPVEYMRKRNAIRRYRPENALKYQKFCDFRNQYIAVDDTGYTTYQQYLDNPPAYDIFLCGSDQIWNPNLYCSNGFYFAGFAPEKALKIAYSSSIGVSSVTAEQANFMRPLLKRLDVISVREEEGAAIVRQISGKEARTVLDPTLLLSNKEWDQVCASRLIEGPYVFCYLFGERQYIEDVKQTVKELTGMKMVCIPYVAREMASDDEKVFDAGPAEFISLIKHASLVLTDSFHATAFSINYGVPFLTLCRFDKHDPRSMNSRLTTILKAVRLESRLIDEGDLLTKEDLFHGDYLRAQELLDARRASDGTFLLQSLQQ